jgi:putative ABC transport system ATP-binding protein
VTTAPLASLSWLLPPPAVIDLRGVGRSYPGSPPVTALSPVDLTVQPGELIIVTGTARSGKSTLLHLIGLLDRPTTGRYLLNGLDTAALGERDRSALRARQIGFVFQRPHLLPSRSALDNVALALLYTGLPGRQRRRTAVAMLDRAGITGRAVNAKPGQLSDSERQRVAIARALAAGPSLLLCDEPTARLDRESATPVIDLVASLNHDGRAVLIATSDPILAAHGSRTCGVGPSRIDATTSPGW